MATDVLRAARDELFKIRPGNFGWILAERV